MAGIFIQIICSFLFIGFISVGCSNDEESTYQAGEEFIDGGNRVIYIDTLSVEASTIVLDSIETNNTGQILVGKILEQELGSVEVSSYLNFQPNNIYSNDVSEDYVFDSLIFVLNYSGYWYGDTTLEHELFIHHLNEPLEKDDDENIYNLSSFSYQDEPIAHLAYIPKPQEAEELLLRMDDDFGKELFRMLQEESDTISNTSLFEKKYPGFVIVPGNETTSVIGFKCSSSNDSETTTALLRLYYHNPNLTVDDPDDELLSFDFIVSDVSDQFNRFETDRSGTPLVNLVENTSGLTSTETSNVTYIQGGSPLLTLLKFPFIDQLLNFGENSTLLSAELRVEPVNGSFDDSNYLPDSLAIYIVNKKYRLTGQMTNLAGNYVISTPVIDDEFNENNYYLFDITNYLYADLDDELPSKEWIAIGLPWEEIQGSVTRLCIGDGNHSQNRIKLLVHYIVY